MDKPTVEIIYNPYVLNTAIYFNGKKPRINSKTELLSGCYLQRWMRELPQIIHDEMNGYDFDLEFSGTRQDFEEIKAAFRDAGVKDGEVSFFLKNELDGRIEKFTQIKELLAWLKDHPSRDFDYAEFRKKYAELFAEFYECVLIGGERVHFLPADNMDLSVVFIQDIFELEETDVTDTPLIFYFDSRNQASFEYQLKKILKKENVIQDQIFFLLGKDMDLEKAERIIRDLGVENPQMVSAEDQSRLRRYLELYPLSDYITSAIRAFNEEIERINKRLSVKKRKALLSNRGVYASIRIQETSIDKINAARERYINRDNYEEPQGFSQAKTYFLSRILGWRNKKIKVTNEPEALFWAGQFEEDLQKFYSDYKRMLLDDSAIFLTQKLTEYRSWYESAETEETFTLPEFDFSSFIFPEAPSIKSDLADMKRISYVLPKDDLITQLLKGASTVNQEPVTETAYFFSEWRKHVSEIAAALADEAMSICRRNLAEMLDEAAEKYLEKLEDLQNRMSRQKEEKEQSLSESGRKVQTDSDWAKELEKKITKLVRQ